MGRLDVFSVGRGSLARVVLTDGLPHSLPGQPLSPGHQVLVRNDNGPDVGWTLTCMDGADVVWAAHVPGTVTSVGGSSVVVVAGCSDGSLVLLCAVSGRMLSAPLMLDGAVVCLTVAVHPGMVLALTSVGTMYSWHLVGLKLKLARKAPCAHLGQAVAGQLPHTSAPPGDVAVTVSNLTVSPPNNLVTMMVHAEAVVVAEEGRAARGPSADEVFALDPDTECWVRVADRRLPTSLLAGAVGAVSPLGDLGRQLRTESANWSASSRALALRGATPGLEQRTTISHLEQWLQAAVLAGSACDFLYWYRLYAGQVCRYGDCPRLRALCDDLEAGVEGPGGFTLTGVELPGLSKTLLLRELVSKAGTNVALQRVLSNYC